MDYCFCIALLKYQLKTISQFRVVNPATKVATIFLSFYFTILLLPIKAKSIPLGTCSRPTPIWHYHPERMICQITCIAFCKWRFHIIKITNIFYFWCNSVLKLKSFLAFICQLIHPFLKRKVWFKFKSFLQLKMFFFLNEFKEYE